MLLLDANSYRNISNNLHCSSLSKQAENSLYEVRQNQTVLYASGAAVAAYSSGWGNKGHKGHLTHIWLLGGEGASPWNREISHWESTVCFRTMIGTDTPEKMYKSLLAQHTPCPVGRQFYVPKRSTQPESVSRTPAWFEMVSTQEDICWVKTF